MSGDAEADGDATRTRDREADDGTTDATDRPTVLVTGAAGGIGRATAAAFADAGYDVVAADVDRAGAERTVADLDAATLAVEMDVSDAASVDAGVTAAADRFGGIDVLVTAAGVQTDRGFLSLPVEEWDRVLGVNLTGTFLASQRVAWEMVDRGTEGRIVTVTSVHQSLPRRRRAHYDASKAGAWMLTREMALELADHRINVNAVAPGAVETAMNAGILADEAARAAVTDLVPWDRWATPAEVAEVVRYLGHDAPDYVTGTCLRVDGGLGLAGVE